MKTEEDVRQEQVIDIHLTRGVLFALVGLLLVVAVTGFLLWTQREAVAAARNDAAIQASGVRAYYLTSEYRAGNEVLDACATGYHTASMWEIMDTTVLQYDTTLGIQRADSGSGPPTAIYGWVRTGYENGTSSTPGTAACMGWASASGSYNGTRIRLPTSWTSSALHISPWEADAEPCSAVTTGVWCVED